MCRVRGDRIRSREAKGHHRNSRAPDHKGKRGHSGKGCWFPPYILMLGVVNHKRPLSLPAGVWNLGTRVTQLHTMVLIPVNFHFLVPPCIVVPDSQSGYVCVWIPIGRDCFSEKVWWYGSEKESALGNLNAVYSKVPTPPYSHHHRVWWSAARRTDRRPCFLNPEEPLKPRLQLFSPRSLPPPG